MLNKETFVPMAFFKKEYYTGSLMGMRYRVGKSEDKLEAIVYPEPCCFESTPEQSKTRQEFPYTEEGREQTISWLNQQYLERKEIWDAVRT